MPGTPGSGDAQWERILAGVCYNYIKAKCPLRDTHIAMGCGLRRLARENQEYQAEYERRNNPTQQTDAALLAQQQRHDG